MLLRPSQVHELLRLAAKHRQALCKVHTSAVVSGGHVENWHGPERNANREVVGYGHAGNSGYTDRLDHWYPCVRFQESNPKYLTLHEKEQGDWKNLTVEDRKYLYRHSFRQTYSEFMVPMGYWKPGVALYFYSIGLVFVFVFIFHRFMSPIIPPTYTQQYKEYALQRQIDQHSEPLDGVASMWDYEKNMWKK
jgi:cytochrome c oxidase subunit 4